MIGFAQEKSVQLGATVLNTVDQMVDSLLENTLVGETLTIDTAVISLFVTKVSGQKISEKIMIGQSQTYIKFTEEFCLEEKVDGVCKADAGIKAAVFDIDPVGKVKSSSYLSPNSKVLQLELSNSLNENVLIEKVENKNGSAGIEFVIERDNMTTMQGN